MKIRSILTGVLASILVAPMSALASTHVACGDGSMAIGMDDGSSSVMLFNDGSALYRNNVEDFKTHGTWVHASNGDVRVYMNGESTVFRDALNQTCEFMY